MAVEIAPLTAADIPGAVDSIQHAFAEDPYNAWIYPDKALFSRPRNCASLRLRCEWGIRNGLFLVAKDAGAATPAARARVLGVAMWLPPRRAGAPQPWTEWAWGWALWVGQGLVNGWWGRGGLDVKRYYIWKRAQSAVQHALWTDPAGYYFCNIVAVQPDAQGRGIGRQLFKAVTDRADAEGRRCYLESSRDEPNIRIYERMGFRLMQGLECDDGGVVCKLYAMIRDPQTVGASSGRSMEGSEAVGGA